MTEEKTQNSETNPFRDLPSLETERLLLKKLTMKDANDIYEYASDPEVSKYVTWEPHRSVVETVNFIKAVIKQYIEGQPSPWAIIYKENNKVIGTGGYHMWIKEHGKAEIGYAISARYWNQGIMSEALREIISFGFERMNLHRAEARVYVENTASERVMQKCGMKYEGVLRESWFVKGIFQDIKMYSILKSEFYSNLTPDT
jgi:ribosomal-protein-alanine N-acetyltransferase